MDSIGNNRYSYLPFGISNPEGHTTLAADLGIREFRRVAALNLYPKFIKALADIVLNAFQT